MRMKILFLFPVMLVAGALSLASCSKNHVQASAETDYDYAVRLLDHGQYSAAIEVMEGHISTAPDDGRARLLLASAYAGRAGVQLTDFFDLAKELMRASKSDPHGLDGLKKTDAMEFLDRLYKALHRLENFLRAFNLVPDVRSDRQVQDLRTAVQILNEDQGSNLSRGAILYRGLLKIVLLKHSLRHESPLDLTRNCKLPVAATAQRIHRLYDDVRSVFDDVAEGTAQPRTRRQIHQAAADLEKSFARVLDALENFKSDATIDLGAQCRRR